MTVADRMAIRLTPGKHSALIKAIIEEFGPRYAPSGQVIYVGDTGDKWGYFDSDTFRKLGMAVDAHGKMPDVLIYAPERNWLLLIEAVTSHGPVDGKRHDELAHLFSTAKAGLIYITAFPSRREMARYIQEISWETEVWIADTPEHLIHIGRFKGTTGIPRFPLSTSSSRIRVSLMAWSSCSQPCGTYPLSKISSCSI